MKDWLFVLLVSVGVIGFVVAVVDPFNPNIMRPSLWTMLTDRYFIGFCFLGLAAGGLGIWLAGQR